MLALPVAVVGLHTVVRIVRHFVKFPVPEVLADLIDNPLRRRVQPPDLLAERHGVRTGMTVLDVGPGNGRYTLAAARAVGPRGHVHAIDLEPRMIQRVHQRAASEGVTTIEARVADVYALPYPDDFFDVVYLITVTGEIPEPVRMLRECCRVLKPAGTLGVSELLTDPDYPLRRTVTAWATAAGFRPAERHGNFFSYTLTFKP
jgi:ubiquinone/menaquinone biosynthesis C-methylase UbiE